MLTVKNRYRLVNTVIIVLLCKSGVNVSAVVDVAAEEVDGGMSVDFFFQVVLGESEVEVVVDVLDGVSDSVNV